MSAYKHDVSLATDFDPETYEPTPVDLILLDLDLMAARHEEAALLAAAANPLDSVSRGRRLVHREAAHELRALAKRWSEAFPVACDGERAAYTADLDDSAPF